MQEITDPKASGSLAAEQARLKSALRKGSLAPGIARLAIVFSLIVAVSFLYWPSAVSLNALWGGDSATFHDGYMVLLVSLWLIVRDRERLARAPLHPAPGALLALGALSFAWVWAWRAAIQEAHIDLIPLLLFASVIATMGWRAARVVMFPIAFLYFATPILAHTSGFLQQLSARMTGMLLWIAGVPAYMQGNLIHLPWGTVHIASGCSGVNQFVVGLALGALYGTVAEGSPRRRIAWLGVMGILALIDNWVRIFVITVIAYVTRMRNPLVRHHIWFGWVLFSLTFAAFLWWAERSRNLSDTKTSAGAFPLSEPSVPALSRVTWPVAMGLTFAVLALLPLLSYGMDWARAGPKMPVRISWPAGPPGWQGPQSPGLNLWAPRFIDAGGESLVQYVEAGEAVQAYVVAYRVQTQAGKVLGYSNSLLGDPKHLHVLSRRIVTSPSGRWREIVAIDQVGQRFLIWSRYRIGNRVFIEPRLGQLWYGLRALVRPPLSSVIALRTICNPDCRSAQSRLDTVSAWARPTLR